MARADYYEGLTIEGDEFPPKPSIDGRQVEGVKTDREGLFFVSEHPEVRAKNLIELGTQIIDRSPELKEERECIRDDHVRILKGGVVHWNAWRRENPATRPLIFNSDLRKEILGLSDLNSVDFANANLINSNLSAMHLKGANFHEANLGGADLSHACLAEANFCRSDLYRTNLSHACLHQANLQGTQLAMTNFTGAKLIGCKIYGMSAWDLILDDTMIQKDLVILYRKENAVHQVDESHILVGSLESAQFVYLLLNNPKIRDAVDTITSKVVLILGRFTKERISVLEKVREELRRLQYVPILFDFDQPRNRDVTDTVTLLAQMSLFVIVDLTDPSSSPYELSRVYDATKVPIQSIILEDHTPFSMFWDLKAASPQRVMDLFPYRDVHHLIDSLSGSVISPPVDAGRKLREARQAADKGRADWEARHAPNRPD